LKNTDIWNIFEGESRGRKNPHPTSTKRSRFQLACPSDYIKQRDCVFRIAMRIRDRRNSATGNFSSYTCITRNRRQGTSGEDVGRVTFRLPPTRSAAPRARFSERIIARPLRISRRALSFSLADTILNAGKKSPFAADDV